MSLDALFGMVRYNGVVIELGGGLNFTGAGVVVAYNQTTKMIDITISSGGGGSGHTIANRGTALAARAMLNFAAALRATDNSGAGRTDVDLQLDGGSLSQGVNGLKVSASTFSYIDAGDAAVTALIPAAGGAPGALNLAGSAAAAGSGPDFARQDHNHSITGRLPFANFVAASAGGKLVGSTGVGSFQELGLAGGVELNGSNVQVASTLPARGTENVAIDLYPSTQDQQTVNTGGTKTWDVAIPTGKRVAMTASVWVGDGAGEACLYYKELRIVAHQTGGAAVKVSDVTAAAPLEGAGFTFAASVSTTNIRFTLGNTSGTNRPCNIAIGDWRMDKP